MKNNNATEPSTNGHPGPRLGSSPYLAPGFGAVAGLHAAACSAYPQSQFSRSGDCGGAEQRPGHGSGVPLLEAAREPHAHAQGEHWLGD
jgi:hypothetical protein